MRDVEMQQGSRMTILILAAVALLLPLLLPPPAAAGKPAEVGKPAGLFDQYGRVILDAGGLRRGSVL